MIPSSILNQVKKEAIAQHEKGTNPPYKSGRYDDTIAGAEFMYSLLQFQLEEKEKEVETQQVAIDWASKIMDEKDRQLSEARERTKFLTNFMEWVTGKNIEQLAALMTRYKSEHNL